MPTKGTSVRGIRLPDGVWQELDEQAHELDMSRNAFIHKLLTKRLRATCEVPDSDENDLPEYAIERKVARRG